MNNSNLKIHFYQKKILQKLVLSLQLKFNELNIEGLESEHMNYHLKNLIQNKLVAKEGNLYRLTDLGKDYTNLLDDDSKIIERQPKTSIIIRGIRKNEVTGKIEHLMMKRLKQPYYGKVGRITGKVRFGETFEEAAARELYEETGLTANSFELEEIYHKIRKREDGEVVQDVIFYIFLVKGLSGTLIEKSEIQENFWQSSEELLARDDTYDDLNVDESLEAKPLKVTQSVALAEGF